MILIKKYTAAFCSFILLFCMILAVQSSAAEYSVQEVTYEWVMNTDNISPGDPDRDGETDWIDIGFEFPFFNKTYNKFWLSSEGFICFGSITTYCYNSSQIDSLPSTHPQNYAKPKIAALWDDLDTGG